MKRYPLKKTLLGLFLGGTACFWAIPGVNAQGTTIDIADFLVTEPGLAWNMTGTALYSGFNLELDMTLTTEPGDVLHGSETTRIKMDAAGSFLFYSAQVIEEIQVSLSGDGLRLHSRTEQVYFNGELDDEDIEVYLTPATILPRLVTVGESYPFLAELEEGAVNDFVLIDSVEMIETALGTVEAVKLVAFTEDEVPVTLWLARGVGYVKAEVNTDVDDDPLVVSATLTSTDAAFAPEDVAVLWADTLNNGNGWRYADWLGHFWALDAGANWINHFGLDWMYCIGNPASLWMYHLGNEGWLWSSADAYPIFYNAVNGHYLLHTPGSPWFFDYDLNDYVNLSP